MRFDEKAFQYHEKASIQKTVADWCAEWIERDCSKLVGLELGAGTGLLTKHLGLRGFSDFCATDISSSMLREGEARLPLVRWEWQDAWRLEKRKADRIYACSLLQWAPHPLEVLREWREALRPGGRILACFFIEDSLREFSHKDPHFPAFPWKSESEWVDLFRESDLRIRRRDTRLDTIAYSTGQEALRHIHDLGAVSPNRMSHSQLRRFLEKLDQSKDAGFKLSWRSLRVECEDSG